MRDLNYSLETILYEDLIKFRHRAITVNGQMIWSTKNTPSLHYSETYHQIVIVLQKSPENEVQAVSNAL